MSRKCDTGKSDRTCSGICSCHLAGLQEHSEHDRKKESLFVPAQVLGIEKVPVTYIAGIFPAEPVKRFVCLVPGGLDLYGTDFGPLREKEIHLIIMVRCLRPPGMIEEFVP